MRAKHVFITVMTALIMFLTGVLSGHYYAYHQWGQVYQDENQTISADAAELETEEDGAENDLEERQEDVRERGGANFFSELGKTIGGSPR